LTEDFPEGELRESFQEIKHALIWRPAKGNEGTVKATTLQMGDQEARELIEKIPSLYDEIAQFYGVEYQHRAR
jgi:hypothetical protein